MAPTGTVGLIGTFFTVSTTSPSDRGNDAVGIPGQFWSVSTGPVVPLGGSGWAVKVAVQVTGAAGITRVVGVVVPLGQAPPPDHPPNPLDPLGVAAMATTVPAG